MIFFNFNFERKKKNCTLNFQNIINNTKSGFFSNIAKLMNLTRANQNQNHEENNHPGISNNNIINNNTNNNDANLNSIISESLNSNSTFNSLYSQNNPNNNIFNDNLILNNYLKKIISEYERIQFDKTNFKLCLLILIDLLDNIFREIRVNEIEIGLRLLTFFSTFFLKGENLIINLYCFNVRLKLVMELLSRFILFLVENLTFINVTIPLYIILGRPREYFQYNDQLLFQLNYLTLKPNSEKFADNWFLEALNFHKIKNMIFFFEVLPIYFFNFFAYSYTCA